METKLKKEWFEAQWTLIADRDQMRGHELKKLLVEIGFPEERTQIVSKAEDALDFIGEKNAAIVFVDDSLGTGAFREIHAHLSESFGASGFYLFTVTEGGISEFTQFAAVARIDGLIFRPYRKDEFQRRVAETFTVKWPNRYVPGGDGADLFFIGGRSDGDTFKAALEKERRLGHRDALTPDPKLSAALGLKRIEHPAIKPGKAAFERVRLSFRVVSVNGTPLSKPVPIHALEVDEYNATFECGSNTGWEAGDHATIEAEIVHGPENFHLRIEANVTGEAHMGLVCVEFDEGNRTRFEAAMRMVTKRFKELKDFFKYAKGA